jgi:hypothetical protein
MFWRTCCLHLHGQSEINGDEVTVHRQAARKVITQLQEGGGQKTLSVSTVMAKTKRGENGPFQGTTSLQP